jgi:ribosomal protein S18 acetylase RimI-like enzyme
LVNIKSLEADDLHSFLDFFDHRAFANDSDWDGCYCQAFLEQPAWDGVSDPKPVLRQASCDKINQGKMQGYLAFEGDKLVGWCAAGESRLFAQLPDAEEKLARVVCFVIDEDYRGQGIANLLLDFAIEDLAKKGFAEIEARPAAIDDTSKQNFRGAWSMYSKRGFTPYRDLGEAGVLVRKEL